MDREPTGILYGALKTKFREPSSSFQLEHTALEKCINRIKHTSFTENFNQGSHYFPLKLKASFTHFIHTFFNCSEFKTVIVLEISER